MIGRPASSSCRRMRRHRRRPSASTAPHASVASIVDRSVGRRDCDACACTSRRRRIARRDAPPRRCAARSTFASRFAGSCFDQIAGHRSPPPTRTAASEQRAPERRLRAAATIVVVRSTTSMFTTVDASATVLPTSARDRSRLRQRDVCIVGSSLAARAPRRSPRRSRSRVWKRASGDFAIALSISSCRPVGSSMPSFTRSASRGIGAARCMPSSCSVSSAWNGRSPTIIS